MVLPCLPRSLPKQGRFHYVSVPELATLVLYTVTSDYIFYTITVKP